MAEAPPRGQRDQFASQDQAPAAGAEGRRNRGRRPQSVETSFDPPAAEPEAAVGPEGRQWKRRSSSPDLRGQGTGYGGEFMPRDAHERARARAKERYQHHRDHSFERYQHQRDHSSERYQHQRDRTSERYPSEDARASERFQPPAQRELRRSGAPAQERTQSAHYEEPHRVRRRDKLESAYPGPAPAPDHRDRDERAGAGGRTHGRTSSAQVAPAAVDSSGSGRRVSRDASFEGAVAGRTRSSYVYRELPRDASSLSPVGSSKPPPLGMDGEGRPPSQRVPSERRARRLSGFDERDQQTLMVARR